MDFLRRRCWKPYIKACGKVQANFFMVFQALASKFLRDLFRERSALWWTSRWRCWFFPKARWLVSHVGGWHHRKMLYIRKDSDRHHRQHPCISHPKGCWCGFSGGKNGDGQCCSKNVTAPIGKSRAKWVKPTTYMCYASGCVYIDYSFLKDSTRWICFLICGGSRQRATIKKKFEII